MALATSSFESRSNLEMCSLRRELKSMVLMLNLKLKSTDLTKAEYSFSSGVATVVE